MYKRLSVKLWTDWILPFPYVLVPTIIALLCSLKEAVTISAAEAVLLLVRITIFLLLNKKEILKILNKVKQKKYTIVPTQMYV